MTLEEQLNTELVRAMKAGERPIMDTIRMVKSRVSEKRTAPGFQGPMTDALVREVIITYVKSLKKAIVEFEAGGAKDNPILDKYRFEIDFLGQYLPRTLDEGETRILVREAIAELGVNGPAAVGRVMGAVMKTRKDEVDSALVRRIAEEELART